MPEIVILRRCYRCKLQKPLNEFRRNITDSSGHGWECKTCSRELARLYHRENREVILKKWNMPEHKVKKLEWGRKYREIHPQKRTSRKSYARDRKKVLAKKAVWNAVKNGRLTRPKHCDCCSKPCHPEAHHYLGYEIEHRLCVKWLCHKCHMARHRIQNPLQYYRQQMEAVGQRPD